MKRGLIVAAALVLGSFLNACISVHTYRSSGFGPPAPLCCRVVGNAPSADSVWTDGHWNVRDGRWEWVDGRWQVPPHPGAAWAPGQWAQSRKGEWIFHPGHWQ